MEVVCSAEEGLVKPDIELYLRTCRKLGVAPGHAVFIDDRLEIVAGARAAGLRAELFANAEQLLSLVANLTT